MRSKSNSKSVMVRRLAGVERLAKTSKVGRLLRKPLRYLHAIGFREWRYKKNRREKPVHCRTFFGTRMKVLLPASTDIYLTGGKSHDSEIRLARLLINELDTGDVFIDVGAHYGYFTLLGSNLVGSKGGVYAFEASPTTYDVLEDNVAGASNVRVHNLAVSDRPETLQFNEFPNLYAEYNAIDVNRHKKASWFKQFAPRTIDVESIPLGNYIETHQLRPKVIKVDVEGAELQVVLGLRDILVQQPTILVLEFLASDTGNATHRAADDVMRSIGYLPHAINPDGSLLPVDNINSFLQDRGIESDNVVFIKS